MQTRTVHSTHEITGTGLSRTAVDDAAASPSVASTTEDRATLRTDRESVFVPSTRITTADAGLFILRAALAAVFIFHGGQKLFGLFGGHGFTATAESMAGLGLPLPFVSAALAGSAEFFGGLALLLGLWPRIAAIPLVFTMIVAIVTAHWGKFSAQAGGMEYPLTLAAALLAIALIGGGKIGLTALLRRVG